MANVSPFLQMLLSRKRNDPSIFNPETVDPTNAPVEGAGPTIALRPKPSMPVTDTAGPSIPVAPQTTQGIDINEPTIPISGVAGQTVAPRDVIQEDRDALQAAQSKHIPLGKRILEGLGTYAASGIGLNLRPILHPGGTDTEKAARQLNIDLGIRKADTENQSDQQTIALRSAQQRKIDADLQAALNDPGTEDEAKAIATGLGAFKDQSSTPANDAVYARLKARAAKIGIELPETYGKQPTSKTEAGFTLAPGQTRFDPTGKPIANLPGVEKPEPTVTPDTALRANNDYQDKLDTYNGLKNQRTEILKALPDAKANAASTKEAVATLQAQYAAMKSDDPNRDLLRNKISQAQQDAKEARGQLTALNKQHNDVQAQTAKLSGGTPDKDGWYPPPKQVAAPARKGAPPPSTHSFSIRAYIQRNKGATEADARAYAAANYPGYAIAP